MVITTSVQPETSDDRTLTLTRLIHAPPRLLFRAWTEPELLKQWFAPLPYTTPIAELDVRAGGSSLIVMRSPEGQDMPNSGVYLEVIKDRKIVATDAFTKAWEPSHKPFMTLVLTFEPDGDKTLYTATVHHWTVADKEKHQAMGFHHGWGICADQLTTLVTKLKS